MANQERSILVQCLAAVSMADDDLDSREIATQISIVEQITGTAPSADEIVAASIDMEDWKEFLNELEGKSKDIDPEFATKILQACILIGRADDSMSEAESERIRQLAKALGIDQDQLDQHLQTIR